MISGRAGPLLIPSLQDGPAGHFWADTENFMFLWGLSFIPRKAEPRLPALWFQV